MQAIQESERPMKAIEVPQKSSSSSDSNLEESIAKNKKWARLLPTDIMSTHNEALLRSIIDQMEENEEYLKSMTSTGTCQNGYKAVEWRLAGEDDSEWSEDYYVRMSSNEKFGEFVNKDFYFYGTFWSGNLCEGVLYGLDPPRKITLSQNQSKWMKKSSQVGEKGDFSKEYFNEAEIENIVGKGDKGKENHPVGSQINLISLEGVNQLEDSKKVQKGKKLIFPPKHFSYAKIQNLSNSTSYFGEIDKKFLPHGRGLLRVSKNDSDPSQDLYTRLGVSRSFSLVVITAAFKHGKIHDDSAEVKFSFKSRSHRISCSIKNNEFLTLNNIISLPKRPNRLKIAANSKINFFPTPSTKIDFLELTHKSVPETSFLGQFSYVFDDSHEWENQSDLYFYRDKKQSCLYFLKQFEGYLAVCKETLGKNYRNELRVLEGVKNVPLGGDDVLNFFELNFGEFCPQNSFLKHYGAMVRKNEPEGLMEYFDIDTNSWMDLAVIKATEVDCSTLYDLFMIQFNEFFDILQKVVFSEKVKKIPGFINKVIKKLETHQIIINETIFQDYKFFKTFFNHKVRVCLLQKSDKNLYFILCDEDYTVLATVDEQNQILNGIIIDKNKQNSIFKGTLCILMNEAQKKSRAPQTDELKSIVLCPGQGIYQNSNPSNFSSVELELTQISQTIVSYKIHQIQARFSAGYFVEVKKQPEKIENRSEAKIWNNKQKLIFSGQIDTLEIKKDSKFALIGTPFSSSQKQLFSLQLVHVSKMIKKGKKSAQYFFEGHTQSFSGPGSGYIQKGLFKKSRIPKLIQGEFIDQFENTMLKYDPGDVIDEKGGQKSTGFGPKVLKSVVVNGPHFKGKIDDIHQGWMGNEAEGEATALGAIPRINCSSSWFKVMGSVILKQDQVTKGLGAVSKVKFGEDCRNHSDLKHFYNLQRKGRRVTASLRRKCSRWFSVSFVDSESGRQLVLDSRGYKMTGDVDPEVHVLNGQGEVSLTNSKKIGSFEPKSASLKPRGQGVQSSEVEKENNRTLVNKSSKVNKPRKDSLKNQEIGKKKSGVGRTPFSSTGTHLQNNRTNSSDLGNWIISKKSKSFKLGKIIGKGELKYANGAVYNGDLLFDIRHGKGKMVFTNGESYEGEWRNGLRSGQGVQKWVYGDRYSGEFLLNHPHGFGVLELTTGETMEGSFSVGNFVEDDDE